MFNFIFCYQDDNVLCTVLSFLVKLNVDTYVLAEDCRLPYGNSQLFAPMLSHSKMQLFICHNTVPKTFSKAIETKSQRDEIVPHLLSKSPERREHSMMSVGIPSPTFLNSII